MSIIFFFFNCKSQNLNQEEKKVLFFSIKSDQRAPETLNWCGSIVALWRLYGFMKTGVLLTTGVDNQQDLLTHMSKYFIIKCNKMSFFGGIVRRTYLRAWVFNGPLYVWIESDWSILQVFSIWTEEDEGKWRNESTPMGEFPVSTALHA